MKYAITFIIGLLLSSTLSNADSVDSLSADKGTEYILSFYENTVAWEVCTIDIGKKYNMGNYDEFEAAILADPTCPTTATATAETIIIFGVEIQ